MRILWIQSKQIDSVWRLTVEGDCYLRTFYELFKSELVGKSLLITSADLDTKELVSIFSEVLDKNVRKFH